MKCERCDTEGHTAEQCWWHTQYPYGLSRWQQIDLLRSALGAATAALASLGSKPQTLAMCREAMAKTEQSPPCDGPPQILQCRLPGCTEPAAPSTLWCEAHCHEINNKLGISANPAVNDQPESPGYSACMFMELPAPAPRPNAAFVGNPDAPKLIDMTLAPRSSAVRAARDARPGDVWDLWGAGQTKHRDLYFDLPVFFGEPVHLINCEFHGGLHVPHGSVGEGGLVRGEFTVDGKPLDAWSVHQADAPQKPELPQTRREL